MKVTKEQVIYPSFEQNIAFSSTFIRDTLTHWSFISQNGSGIRKWDLVTPNDDPNPIIGVSSPLFTGGH